MLHSLKHIVFCFLFSVISVYSQNTASDYNPSQLISYGLDAPARMTIDSNDHIYVIDAGKVIDNGKHESLMNTSDLYKNFYEKQIQK